MKIKQDTVHSPSEETHPWVSSVESFLRQIRFGSVEIIVQEGRIVQIHKTERMGRALPPSRGKQADTRSRYPFNR